MTKVDMSLEGDSTLVKVNHRDTAETPVAELKMSYFSSVN